MEYAVLNKIPALPANLPPSLFYNNQLDMMDFSGAEHHIQCVSNFQDLVATPFRGDVNAIGWTRALPGDFAEIVDKLALDGNLMTVAPKALQELVLTEQGQLAREVILTDLKLLKDHGAAPVLNLIRCYDRDDSYPFFPTDVYSFHVDRATVPADTFLCTYYGEPSDILPNEAAEQKVLVPEIRQALRELHGEGEADFDAFLAEYFFDLHYRAKPGARPVSLGVGHLWRLAIDHPEREVLPCVHRAPQEKNGQNRLMMIC